MTMRRTTALAGGLVLTAVAQAVMAQTAPATPESPASLGAVTITATKREERLQDLPAAATVVQSQQLEQQNITTVQDVDRSSATLTSTAGALSIRGFGGGSFSLSAESSVGILVDGVALSGAGAYPPNLFDVERIEVLEGPQGTLFGKNATAGVVNIVTRAPSTKAFGGHARADVMNRDGKSAQLALNVPVNDSLAFRVTGSVLHDPRMKHNLTDDSWDQPRKENGRVRVLWKAAPGVTVNLIADQSVTKPQGGVFWTIYSATPGSPLSRALAACGVKVGPENTDGCMSPGEAVTKVSGQSAQVDWNVGDYTLTSVSAWRKASDAASGADLDSLPFPAPSYNQPNDKRHRNFSQEFRVASPDYDWGNFVAGVYYFKGDVFQEISPVLNTGAFKLGQRNMISAETKSLAAFSQATYRLNKQLSLNLGVRIGREEAIAGRTATIAPGAVAPLSSLAPVSGSVSDSYASYRLGAQYEFTRNNMGYVNYAQGYKGPAVNDNATSPAVPLIVSPEIPKTLEVGMKNLFLDGRLGVNVAAWDTKIKNFQAQVFNPTTLSFVFSNAPQATNRGVSVNVYGRPSAAWTLNGGVAYMVSKYGPGYLLECAVGAPAGCTQDATGAQIGGTPRLKATVAAEYGFNLGDYRAFMGADAVYTSERVFNPQDAMRNIGARTTLGARMGFRSASGNWGVTLYARNLTDEFQPTHRLGNLLGFVAGDTKSYAQFVGPESRRLIGVSVDAKF